ncbi:hypothetical protein [Phyllobacterium endophyticum]|uniref:hypothetical protein n=1 Tax=Phyllobacterium endophyticum TaxID=1149773 RepID=UPI0011CB230F|nr:hypothetical protein [Phyllobacterium endophyticum]TXR50090.1 hypothetical protein FVA77_06815 [Phyllobacterium endophyticum]
MTEELTQDDEFDRFHTGLSVILIATPRKVFKTCTTSENLRQVAAKNTQKFDYLPVRAEVNEQSDLIGLLRLSEYFDQAAPDESVACHFTPLREQNLIGADASILDFVRSADEYRFRLVVSQRGIVGLVGLSDLQKLPVRAMLFSLVTALEISMADAIRNHILNRQVWEKYLSVPRREKIDHEISKAMAKGGIVDELLFTQFCDKRDILDETVLSTRPDRDLIKQKFRNIESLRNDLAHANDYAATTEDAVEVCKMTRDIIDLTRLITLTN